MANIRIRKLDDWVLDVHKRLASNLNDSLENHVRRILTKAAVEAQNQFADKAEARVRRLRDKYGDLPPSEILVSEERWERG